MPIVVEAFAVSFHERKALAWVFEESEHRNIQIDDLAVALGLAVMGCHF